MNDVEVATALTHTYIYICIYVYIYSSLYTLGRLNYSHQTMIHAPAHIRQLLGLLRLQQLATSKKQAHVDPHKCNTTAQNLKTGPKKAMGHDVKDFWGQCSLVGLHTPFPATEVSAADLGGAKRGCNWLWC